MEPNEKASLIKDIIEINDWMHEHFVCEPNEVEAIIYQDYYEVVAVIHLKNGQNITLSNHIYESCKDKDYRGDEIGVSNDTVEITQKKEYNGKRVNSFVKIPISSISYIESFSADIDIPVEIYRGILDQKENNE